MGTAVWVIAQRVYRSMIGRAAATGGRRSPPVR
jgi:hypothetical protein